MHLWTFLKSGVEVLHLGMQTADSNAWPIEHWRENKGRWRLYTPAVDAFLNEGLSKLSFGSSVERFIFVLEIADFNSWGGPPAFTGTEGHVSYRPKRRELSSVAKLDWLQIQSLTAAQQLEALRVAMVDAVERVSRQKRQPKDFQAERFARQLSTMLKHARVSELGRTAYLRKRDA